LALDNHENDFSGLMNLRQAVPAIRLSRQSIRMRDGLEAALFHAALFITLSRWFAKWLTSIKNDNSS
jgi:hypothetical protein